MFVVDIETTGLNPGQHSIISIGAIDLDSPSREFFEDCRIPEEAVVDERSLFINGYTKDELYNPEKQSLSELIEKFFLWVSESDSSRVLLGENPYFDYGFLKFSARKYKLDLPFGKRLMDLHSLSLQKHIDLGLRYFDHHGQSELSLDHTLAFVGLPPEPKPHLAINGARLEAEAYWRLTRGKHLLDQFKDFPIPECLLQ